MTTVDGAADQEANMSGDKSENVNIFCLQMSLVASLVLKVIIKAQLFLSNIIPLFRTKKDIDFHFPFS